MAQIKLLAILLCLALPVGAAAQLRPQSVVKMEKPDAEKASRWRFNTGYDLTTDLAEEAQPRAYSHRISTSFGYQWNKFWNSGAAADVRANTVGGQIYKDQQQNYREVVRSQPAVFTSYSSSLLKRHTWNLGMRYLVPIDKVSELEGYKGVASLGGGANFAWGRYSMIQKLSVASLINTYTYNTLQQVNPDYFYTYGWDNSFDIWRGLSINFGFGLRMTYYLDGSQSYSYENTYSLNYQWSWISAYVSYANGGFTDDGKVDLWFIDKYRRVVSAGLSARF